MLSYNGFSSNERAKVGRIQLAAIRDGSFPTPKQCELCLQTTGQMQLHNEDYSKPLEDAHPICRACHGALHARFMNPERWTKRKVVIRELRNDGSNPYWWEDLGYEPMDINPNHDDRV